MIDNHAQSETIGNVLLIGVVVVVATTAAVGITFNLTGGGGAGGLGGQAQQADIQASATADNLTLIHNGGERLPGSDVLVVVSNGSAERRFPVDAANLTGSNGRFDPGETFTRAHGLTGDSIDVQVTVGDQGQSRLLLDTTVELPTVVPVTNSVSWSDSDGFSKTTRDNSDYILTGGTSFGQSVGPDGLQLQNVNTTEPEGTSVTIVVQSDPDDDGVYEDTSDPIEYDGSTSYDVTGLSAESQQFRLRVELTPADNSSVSFHSATLTTGSSRITWASASDWDAASSATGIIHEDITGRSAGELVLGMSSTESDLVAYWPLNEDSGTSVSDAADSNDGTVEGATQGVAGILGTTSYEFDGSDDYVSDATDISALRETASVATWLRTTQSGDNTMWQAPGLTGIESSGDGNDIFWGWLNASGHLGVQAGDGDAAQTNTPLNDGSWHHVVMTRDASTGQVEIYLNGTREATVTSTSGTVTNTFSSIGRVEDTADSPEYFKGAIDEFRVYDRVLSSTRASKVYEAYTSGTLVTGKKSFRQAVDPASLELRNVSAHRPARSTVEITVKSDHDGDGKFEEQSRTISIDGSDSYSVTGLNTDSAQYRLVIDLSSPEPTTSPTLNGATLHSS